MTVEHLDLESMSTLSELDECGLLSLFDRVRDDGGVVASGLQGMSTLDASGPFDEESSSDGVDAAGDALSWPGAETPRTGVDGDWSRRLKNRLMGAFSFAISMNIAVGCGVAGLTSSYDMVGKRGRHLFTSAWVYVQTVW